MRERENERMRESGAATRGRTDEHNHNHSTTAAAASHATVETATDRRGAPKRSSNGNRLNAAMQAVDGVPDRMLAMLAMLAMSGPMLSCFSRCLLHGLYRCVLFLVCFLAGVPGASFLFILLLLIASCLFFFFFSLYVTADGDIHECEIRGMSPDRRRAEG